MSQSTIAARPNCQVTPAINAKAATLTPSRSPAAQDDRRMRETNGWLAATNTTDGRKIPNVASSAPPQPPKTKPMNVAVVGHNDAGGNQVWDRLRKISPHFIADPRPSGGSMFRIYRDTRFARDKSPYKTHASAHFEHEQADDVHTPGHYIHLAPRNVYLGAGIWQPDSDTLAKIRAGIVGAPSAWKRAVSAPAFRRRYVVEGETLKRAPQGFDPSHPLIEDLKRKDFTAGVRLTERDALSPRFLDQFTALCTDATPFMKFLTEAVGLPW